jgi:hypothetical protein
VPASAISYKLDDERVTCVHTLIAKVNSNSIQFSSSFFVSLQRLAEQSKYMQRINSGRQWRQAWISAENTERNELSEEANGE